VYASHFIRTPRTTRTSGYLILGVWAKMSGV